MIYETSPSLQEEKIEKTEPGSQTEAKHERVQKSGGKARSRDSETSERELYAISQSAQLLATACYMERIDLSAHGFYITPDIGFDWKTGKGNPFRFTDFEAPPPPPSSPIGLHRHRNFDSDQSAISILTLDLSLRDSSLISSQSDFDVSLSISMSLSRFRSTTATTIYTSEVSISLLALTLPGPDSIGIVAIAHGCTGVAARACGLVGLAPTRNVPPAILLRFLREHRSEWADNSIDAYSAAAVKVGPCSLPGSRVGSFSGQVILPLAHTIEHEEASVGHCPEDAIMPRDMFLLQLWSGMDENVAGTCAELIFAPIDASFADDAPLLPSGFRIIPLDSGKEASNPNRTLDLASPLEIGLAGNKASNDYTSNGGSTRSVMTIAFEFAFEGQIKRSFKNLVFEFRCPEVCYLGVELLKSGSEGSETTLETLWHHTDAIMCCSLKALPVFTFANQAGLDMLETTLVALQDITLEKIFDDHGRKTLCSEFPQIMQQVCNFLLN
ncbi:hypothetical protein HYC85_020967 [Camellia sinensis]|uniref:MEKHLA domain-containing protein n=1 Tax=Camellia sinensis TaxID=4442 RepID=A0A7J7GGB1_CAMSI|nr:hypothetical protein HYC85_020967 [Camellia sinensis]